MFNDEIAIILKNVNKVIKGQTILNNINLEIFKGQVCGFIGRNASGKTMLFRVVCGLIYPTTGNVIVLNKELNKHGLFPDNVGAIIEHPGFLPQYSGRKNLQLLASIRGKISKNEIDDSLRLVGLSPALRKPVKTYSLGMKQRLGIAQAIMEKPDILIMDEPTNSLDNDGVKLFQNIILKLKGEGKTILLSSHIIDDINDLCDKIFYMDNGKIIKEEVVMKKNLS